MSRSMEGMAPAPPSDTLLYRRLAAGVWVLLAVLATGLWVFAPPTEAIGPAGWWVAMASTAVSLVFAARCGMPASRVTEAELSWSAFAVLGQVTLLQWLAGGLRTPYEELLLLSVFASAPLQRGRLAAFLVALAAACTAPLVYDDWQAPAAGAILTYLILLIGLTFLLQEYVRGTQVQKLSLRASERSAQESARTDPLTGLGNRRAFDEMLDHEHARSQRTGAPLSLIVCDLDGFKRVNDHFGHLNGDRLLVQVARAIESTLRRSDRCFRWGGDEFAVLLPDTALAAAKHLERRLRSAVETSVRAPDDTPIRISAASAELRDSMSLNDLVDAADLAMMSAKAARHETRSDVEQRLH